MLFLGSWFQKKEVICLFKEKILNSNVTTEAPYPLQKVNLKVNLSDFEEDLFNLG